MDRDDWGSLVIALGIISIVILLAGVNGLSNDLTACREENEDLLKKEFPYSCAEHLMVVSSGTFDLHFDYNQCRVVEDLWESYIFEVAESVVVEDGVVKITFPSSPTSEEIDYPSHCSEFVCEDGNSDCMSWCINGERQFCRGNLGFPGRGWVECKFFSDCCLADCGFESEAS